MKLFPDIVLSLVVTFFGTIAVLCFLFAIGCVIGVLADKNVEVSFSACLAMVAYILVPGLISFVLAWISCRQLKKLRKS